MKNKNRTVNLIQKGGISLSLIYRKILIFYLCFLNAMLKMLTDRDWYTVLFLMPLDVINAI